jgi:hypothetical protein
MFRGNKGNIEYIPGQKGVPAKMKNKVCLMNWFYGICKVFYVMFIYYFMIYVVLWIQIYNPNPVAC